MKRQRCVLPPLAAQAPAARILLISASGTGSGFNRRIARVVCMISKTSVESDIILPSRKLLVEESRHRVVRGVAGARRVVDIQQLDRAARLAVVGGETFRLIA